MMIKGFVKLFGTITVIGMLMGSTVFASESGYEMNLIDGVKPAMITPEFWNGSDTQLMSAEQIAVLNQSNLAKKETNMNDLKNLPETYNGIAMRTSLAAFDNPKGLFLDGNPVKDSYYDAIRKNITGASANENMKTGYGFVLNRTLMKSLPYAEMLSDSADDVEWDNLANSSVFVNDPVTAYLTTADGKYVYVKSLICEGWIPSEDLVRCHSKEEWLAAQNMDEFLVITGDKVYLESSSADSSVSAKALDMGTKVALAPARGMVDNRMQWYNYVVILPGRGADGLYAPNEALIPMSRDVHVGYLNLTTRAIIEQTMKCLGDRYGWGGMLESRDCSAYVREVYLCFGLQLPRNTTWQGAMNCNITDLSAMNMDNIYKLLDTLPIGTILQFPGHEMIYLGKSGDDYYTINDVSSLIFEDSTGTAIRYRGRGVIINGLKGTKRANGKSWAECLTRAIVIW